MRFEELCLPVFCGVIAEEVPSIAPGRAVLAIGYLQRGQCLVRRQDGAAQAVGAGCFALFAPDAAKLQPGAPGLPMAGWLAAFAGAAPAQLIEGLALPVILPAAAHPGAAELLQRLCEGFELLPPPELSALAYTLLCRFAPAQATAYPPLVQLALDEIHEHYAEVYGVEELADQLMVSKSHLIRMFSAHVGVPPGQYLTAVRVENAKRLLQHGGLGLAAIASLCGFSGADYFCKVFKKATGETPQSWRRRIAPAYPAPAHTQLEQQLYL